MQPLAGVADQRRKPALDGEVHVLVLQGPAELPALDLAPPAREPPLDRRGVALREDAAGAEHARVGERALHVVKRQPFVESERGGELFDRGIDCLPEAAGPKLLLLGHARRMNVNDSMTSIRQDVSADFLPDFRNLGVLARVLIGVNALVLGAALLVSSDLTQATERFLRSATLAEPLLVAAVIALVVALAGLVHAGLLWLLGEPPSDLRRTL